MGMVKNFIIKLIGKRVDSTLEKWHISKAKVTAIIGALVIAYNFISPSFGWPPLPKEVLEILGALGLWALKDGQATPSTSSEQK